MKDINRSIKFLKIREVRTPERAYGAAAATDFFIPEYTPEFLHDLIVKNEHNGITFSFEKLYDRSVQYSTDPPQYKCIGEQLNFTIPPYGQVNIPSGIKTIIEDPETCLLAVNKSGMAAKFGLTVGACLVDADYRGEIHLNLINNTGRPVTLHTGQKVFQFMHTIGLATEWEEINPETFCAQANTERGEGAFGSSNEKDAKVVSMVA